MLTTLHLIVVVNTFWQPYSLINATKMLLVSFILSMERVEDLSSMEQIVFWITGDTSWYLCTGEYMIRPGCLLCWCGWHKLVWDEFCWIETLSPWVDISPDPSSMSASSATTTAGSEVVEVPSSLLLLIHTGTYAALWESTKNWRNSALWKVLNHPRNWSGTTFKQ